jgi:hypothetical protein
LFRGQPALDGPRTPDLEAEIVDLCVASCNPGGLLRVAWRVHNRGRAASPAVAVGLELGEDQGYRPYLRGEVGELPPGRVSDTQTFDLPWTRVPKGGFRIVADPDGEVTECDELDNAAFWDDRVCPG